MYDGEKTKEQLIEELAKLRQQLAKSEVSLQQEITARKNQETRQRAIFQVREKVWKKEDPNDIQQLLQVQKMEAVGQLAAGIAHNFNNRMMVISMAIESLMLTGEYRLDDLEIAASSLDKAAEMVKQLQLFSRTEDITEHQPIPVRQVIQNTVEIARKTFDRNIVLSDKTAGETALVSGDINQLRQTFLNLLLNARDALERSEQHDPCIQITAERVSLQSGDLEAHPEAHLGEYICVRVTDNGVGMDAETQERLFEPFFTTKGIGEGTGLGLATVYAIVKEHGGWITCESQLGVGTTFPLFLPVALQEEHMDVETAPSEFIQRGTEILLLVEDEDDVREQMFQMLTRYGYEVIVGKDGQEGWTLFEQERERIDLVILDLSMPEMSGLEVLKRIRHLDPEVKVILSTGNTDPEMETQEVQDILKKPYRITQALQIIRQVLDE